MPLIQAIKASVVGELLIQHNDHGWPNIGFRSLGDDPHAPDLVGPSALAFDSRRGRLVVYAGGDGNGPGALFAYDPERERWSRLTALGKVRLESMTYLSGADVFYGLSSDGVLYLIGPGGQHLGHRAVTADEVGVGNQDEVLEAIEEADESLQLVSTKDHVFVLSEDRVLPLDPVAPTAK